jgi:serine phosphatase RsbU (regulator of sigma subunit)
MAHTNVFQRLLDYTLRSPGRKEQLAYMRSVPLRRLALILLAAVLLFTAIGLLSAIRSQPSEKYLFTGFATAIYTGLFVGAYTLSTARKPAWILAIIPIQMATTPLLRWFVIHMQAYQVPVPFEQASRLYALCALIATACSYSLFLRFIQREGRYAFRSQAELALAHTIQQTLVPIVDIMIAGCEVYGLSLPSAKVGGDLVDAVVTPDGNGFAYLVDVAGHGLNAGILMGMVKTAARTCLAEESSPGILFDTLNQVLPGVKEAHMYATCVALQLKRQPDGKTAVWFALAGHPPVIHLSASGQIKACLTDEQFPLGLLPFQGYQTRSVFVQEGDVLIATTDGILETCDKNGVELGIASLESLTKACVAMPLPALAQKILAAAKKFGPQNDDRTILLIRIH